MIALAAYAGLSLLIVLFLKPFLNIDRSLTAYAFPFGVVYTVLLFTADAQMFEQGWNRYVGISIGVLCIIFFIFSVIRGLKRE
ncbi:MAG: hypothetical protein VYE27_04225 [Pseudomonadota bacterium]|nr:hypothetical protein [Pseudomonadota bacterium]